MHDSHPGAAPALTRAPFPADPIPAWLSARPWLVVLASMLGVAVCSTPICILSLSVFVKPLAKEFGWGRGDVTFALTILSLSIAAATPPIGHAMDRIGVRRLLVPSLVLFGATLALVPLLIEHYGKVGLYVGYFLIGVLGAGSNTIAYVHVISGWFDRSRGFALGFVTSGVALGGAIDPAFAQALISRFGWQAGFYGLALLPLVVGVPLSVTLVRAEPVSAGPVEVTDATGHVAHPRLVFGILFVLFLLAATFINGIQIHIPALFSDHGFSPAVSVGALSLLFAVSAVTRVGAGIAFDRFFAPAVGAVLFLATGVGIVLLMIHVPPGFAFLAAALVGLGAGAETDLLAYLVSRYFGMQAFGLIYGWLFGAFMIGSAAGPFLLGLSFDLFGSYQTALAAACFSMLVCCGLLASLPRYPKALGGG